VTPAEFCRRLRAARLRAGLTQSQAARLLGVQPGSVARWEQGGSVPPAAAEAPLTRERVLAVLAAASRQTPPAEIS
jgi:transcriptional regulator with XRE-family HTH domain